jgi:hypothetical protein
MRPSNAFQQCVPLDAAMIQIVGTPFKKSRPEP